MTFIENARRTFFVSALRKPAVVGAIGPSGTRLAEQVSSVVPTDGAPTVVELGPGTGPISRAVQRRIPQRGTHLALEVDPRMVAHLRATLPAVDVVQADAAQMQRVLVERGFDAADCVVSTLPWSLFGERTQRTVLDTVARCLTPGGAFTTMAYLNTRVQPSARRFRALLEERFDEVLAASTVWRNCPPAFTYVCRRPR